MAPIPTYEFHDGDARTSTHHPLARRGEEGRIAGLLIGCLLGGIVAAGLIYFCFNCAFAPKPRKKTVAHHHAHAHKPHVHHAHPQAHRQPHVHKWTHHHHRHAHRHRHHRSKAKPRTQCPKTKRRPARRSRRPSRARGPSVRFMPMPPMAMPMAPPPAFGMAVGVGFGMGGGMDDDFIDYGPAPDQDTGLEMGWGMDPNFRLAQFDDGGETDGVGEASCNECCYSFWDALCGIPVGSRDLRREAAGDGAAAIEHDEMAAV